MNFTKKLLTSSLVASVAAVGSFTSVAHAEVVASAAVANTYLWRGFDLGNGTPAVSGDIHYTQGGAYGGVWASSGDVGGGSEFDVYGGYNMKFMDDFMSLDVSFYNYNYPTGLGYVDDDATEKLEKTTLGKLSDLVVAVGAGPVTFTIWDNVAGASGYAYYTLAAKAGDFSVLVGMHDNAEGDDPVHVNLNYAFNANLTFTLSQFVADQPTQEIDGTVIKDDLKFIVSYSLPIGE